jgi:hypothetical protein
MQRWCLGAARFSPHAAFGAVTRLHRRRCAARLQRGSDALLQQVERRAEGIDALFAELDETLAFSKQVGGESWWGVRGTIC